jgi:hypothetical protein
VSDRPVFREFFTAAARFATNPPELAAQLRAALTAPHLGARAAGLARVTRYTWSATAAQHLARYHSLA